MKVKFFCDNGANIHSKRSASFDTEQDLGFDPGEWEGLTDDEKSEHVKSWAMENFDYWYEE